MDALDVSEALLLLAIEPLVLPVSLNELEDDELGEELAEFEEEASLVATEPLVEDVLFEDEPELLSLLEMPLVLPVWLSELVELEEGDEEAEADRFELFAVLDVSLLALLVFELLLSDELLF